MKYLKLLSILVLATGMSYAMSDEESFIRYIKTIDPNAGKIFTTEEDWQKLVAEFYGQIIQVAEEGEESVENVLLRLIEEGDFEKMYEDYKERVYLPSKVKQTLEQLKQKLDKLLLHLRRPGIPKEKRKQEEFREKTREEEMQDLMGMIRDLNQKLYEVGERSAQEKIELLEESAENIQRLLLQKDLLWKHIGNINEQMDVLTEKLRGYEKGSKESKDTIEKLKSMYAQLDQQKKQYQEEVNQKWKEAQAVVARVKEEMASTKASHEDLKKKHFELDKKSVQLRNENQILKKELENAKNKVVVAIALGDPKSIEKAREDLGEKEKEKEKNEKEASVVEGQQTALAKVLTSVKEQIKEEEGEAAEGVIVSQVDRISEPNIKRYYSTLLEKYEILNGLLQEMQKAKKKDYAGDSLPKLFELIGKSGVNVIKAINELKESLRNLSEKILVNTLKSDTNGVNAVLSALDTISGNLDRQSHYFDGSTTFADDGVQLIYDNLKSNLEKYFGDNMRINDKNDNSLGSRLNKAFNRFTEF